MSVRRGALLAVLGFVAILAYVWSNATSDRYLSPADLVGTAAPVGEQVLVGGVVDSSVGTATVVLVPEDASGPRVTILLSSDSPPSTWGPGTVALFRGTLVRPGIVADAHPLRTGPGKYQRAASDRR